MALEYMKQGSQQNFIKYLFIYLASSGLRCITWDLWLWCMESLADAHGLASYGMQA